MLLNYEAKGRSLLGIDGGATKTEFVLFYEDGHVLNRITLEGCNPNVCGIEKSCAILKSGIGGAAYVFGALKEAKEHGCKTISLSSNKDTLIGSVADVEVVTDTGAEVIQGSTRMKAGTAQKLVLNMFSTCVMIKSGKIYENVMINLKPSNIKLRKRMINIVCSLISVDEKTAESALEEHNWVIRDVLES